MDYIDYHKPIELPNGDYAKCIGQTTDFQWVVEMRDDNGNFFVRLFDEHGRSGGYRVRNKPETVELWQWVGRNQLCWFQADYYPETNDFKRTGVRRSILAATLPGDESE